MNTYLLISKQTLKLPYGLSIGQRLTEADMTKLFGLSATDLAKCSRGVDRFAIRHCVFRVEHIGAQKKPAD